MSEVFTLDIQALGDRPKVANVLIYGESGVGKTVFAATAPRPILWLEAEGGTNSIADPSGIDIIAMSGLRSYREVLRYLMTDEGKKYQTVVIDSLTETQAAVLTEVMQAVVRKDHERDEFMPQFAEWGKLTGVMRSIVRAYRDLPVNVVMTALVREDKDDLTGQMKVRPRLAPAVAEEMPGFMDALIYLAASTPKGGEVGADGPQASEDGVTVVRNGLLMPTGKYAAKIRAPEGTDVPTHLTEPTFDQVAALILG